MQLKDLPALGEPLEGGIFAGAITLPAGTHHAVVLLAEKPTKDLAWPAAMAWAEGISAQLPSRPVAAMLFANVGGQFEQRWHWTSEQDKDDSSFAWCQDFDDGYQGYDRQSYEGRARAVRLIQLAA